MLIIIILEIPTWTAIFQAIAAIIAVPGAIAAFIQLFKKDKQREAQINQLANQTKSLNEQVNVLREQLFLTYRPWIKPVVSKSFSGGNLSLTLNNFGKAAIIKSIENLNESKIILLNDLKGYEFESELEIPYSLNDNIKKSTLSFKLKLVYQDLRGLTYEMVVQSDGETISILEDKVLKE